MDLTKETIIELKKSKEISLLRKHPWEFSGAIHTNTNALEDGQLVYVEDSNHNRLGFGHFHHGSIAIKMLHFGKEAYQEAFWEQQLSKALQTRKNLMFPNADTNCYRWVHGEGDQLPGLIIDVYDQTIVIQCHTIGMHKIVDRLVKCIPRVFNNTELCIIDKSASSLPKEYARGISNKIVYGKTLEIQCMEHGYKFYIDALEGQKTGFFLDQRENRKLLGSYSENRTILNAFSYSGGFSIYALAAGAKEVHSIDISSKALDILNRNLEFNAIDGDKHQSMCLDVIDYLEKMESGLYDLIILDPPAFAKNMSKRHTAMKAYKRINALAMKKIKPAGILFTFSCSQVVTEELFYHTIVSAGIESGREIRVLHKLSQGPDHPVSLFHPEGSYLKGMVLEIR